MMTRTGSQLPARTLLVLLSLLAAVAFIACGGKAKAPTQSAVETSYRGEAGALLSQAATAAGRAGDVLSAPDLASAAWRARATAALDEIPVVRDRVRRLVPPASLMPVHGQLLAALDDLSSGAAALRLAVDQQDPRLLAEAAERLPGVAASLTAARLALSS